MQVSVALICGMHSVMHVIMMRGHGSLIGTELDTLGAQHEAGWQKRPHRKHCQQQSRKARISGQCAHPLHNHPTIIANLSQVSDSALCTRIDVPQRIAILTL